MLDEKSLSAKSGPPFDDLKKRLLVLGDEHGFDVEGEAGKLEVTFEEPEEAKFVISPNTPVREIWISALSTSFKLGGMNRATPSSMKKPLAAKRSWWWASQGHLGTKLLRDDAAHDALEIFAGFFMDEGVAPISFHPSLKLVESAERSRFRGRACWAKSRTWPPRAPRK